MKSVTFLIKPASGLCNMQCRYCFYEDITGHRMQKNLGIMSEETAESIIREAFRAVSPGGCVTFMFQGGEPTLAGLDFFRRFMALEQKYAKEEVLCSHAIQTNGFLLTKEWAEFFRQHGFLTGLSMDGTRMLHDSYRIDASGQGTWEKTTAALKLLEEYQVETNLLCVVTGQAARKASQIYRTLTSSGRHPMQFIPCLDPIESVRGRETYSLRPEAYGKFLCSLFDCWYQDWKADRYVSIRNFDDYIRILLRMPPSACAASGICGTYLVAEADGSLYPCDFYVLDRWNLGNIHSCSAEQAMSSCAAGEFLDQSRNRPPECSSCRYMPLCRGGCRRDWLENGSNYYCVSYRMFFDYSIIRLEEMAAAYLRNA